MNFLVLNTYLKNLTTKFEYLNENNSDLKTSYLKMKHVII